MGFRHTCNWWWFNDSCWSKERWNIAGCGDRCIQIAGLCVGNRLRIVRRIVLLLSTNAVQQIEMRMTI